MQYLSLEIRSILNEDGYYETVFVNRNRIFVCVENGRIVVPDFPELEYTWDDNDKTLVDWTNAEFELTSSSVRELIAALR